MALIACSQFTPDFGNAAAIQITGTPTVAVEEGDTTSVHAQALDFSGSPLADTVLWALTTPIKRIDSSSGTPVNIPRGFTVDSATGFITALAPDTSTVIAYLGNLRSTPLTVQVTPQPDTVVATVTRVVVAAGVTESPVLSATVQDLTTVPTNPQGLSGKRVLFQLASPASPALYLEAHTTVSDTLPGTDPTAALVTTVGGGAAQVYVHTVAGQTLPDSAFVLATALTSRGATVKGSPVQFTVVFTKTP